MESHHPSSAPGPRKRPSLIAPCDVRAEVERLFDSGPGADLQIRVHGDDGDLSSEGAQSALREMLNSLRLYGGDAFADQLVPTPDRAAIARGLAVLCSAVHQRSVLDAALTTFGRRLIDPLGDLLEQPDDAELLPRLAMFRDLLLSQVRELRLSQESREIIGGDLARLLGDEYLALIAENECRVQRPRARRLAQEMLRLVATAFHGALRRWPEHADAIATTIARRLPPKARAKEIPSLLKAHVAAAVEEFFWVETSAEILGGLRPLLAASSGITRLPPAELDRAAYQELAEACFGVVAAHC